MTTWSCRSRDGAGALHEEVLTAPTRRDALQILTGRGLVPITIVAARGRPAGKAQEVEASAVRTRGKGVSPKDVGRFTDQLSGLMAAGVPILAGIAAVGEQTQNEHFRAVLKEMYADVKGGMSLSGAMQQHPAAFPEAYVNSIAAGEASGTLEQFLGNLSEFIESDLELKSDVRGALLYPAILITSLGLSVTTLVVFVVPRFARLYGGTSGELPLPTRLLIMLSSALSESFVPIALGLGAAGWLVSRICRTEEGRARLDGLVLRLPLVGNLIDTAITLRVMQMMALFHHVGMPVVEGLRTISRAVSNRRMRADLLAVSDAVASGESLSSSMAMSNCFSPSVRQMIASGETSGSLERSFTTVAKQLKKDLRYHTKNLATCIEPILTLVMAVVVLFVALAAFLPMWNLAQVMRK